MGMKYNRDELEYLLERKKEQGRMARLVGLVWEKFTTPFSWLAWHLWGRRRAIRRFQELAGLTPQAKYPSTVEAPEKVGYVEYPGKPVPPPDTTDVN